MVLSSPSSRWTRTVRQFALLLVAFSVQACSALDSVVGKGDDGAGREYLTELEKGISDADRSALQNMLLQGHLSDLEYRRAVEIAATEVEERSLGSALELPDSLIPSFDGVFDGFEGLEFAGDVEDREFALSLHYASSESPLWGTPFSGPVAQLRASAGNLLFYYSAETGGDWGQDAPDTYEVVGVGVRRPKSDDMSWVFRAGLTRVAESEFGGGFYKDEGLHLAIEAEQRLTDKLQMRLGFEHTSFALGMREQTPTLNVEYRLTERFALSAGYTSMYDEGVFYYGLTFLR